MTGEAIVAKLTEHIPIEGADRIVEVRLLGETIIVSKDTAPGTLGLLFDMETQLSPEFLKNNNLFRHENLNLDSTKKGYFDDNGRVRPIRLKGVKVSGFWIPLDSLSYIGNPTGLKEGTQFTEWEGHKICSKYIPPRTHQQGQSSAKAGLHCAMFKPHFDTDHLLRNLRDVPVGEFVITKKLHGTSGRYGYLLQDNEPKWYERWLGLFKPGIWSGIVGSRTVVKSIENKDIQPTANFYSEDVWTKSAEKFFKGKLLKGETVYYEIVGYIGDSHIQPGSSTEALKEVLSKDEYKKIVETYGKEVNYAYGCAPGQFDVYVYRITMTNVDGDSVDLSWEQVKARCAKLDVPHVPEIMIGRKYSADTYILYNGDYAGLGYDSRGFSEAIEETAFYNSNHLGSFPEGICLRSESYPHCKIFKHKNFAFKCIEQNLKTREVPDTEEEN